MKYDIEKNKIDGFDTAVCASDWRYSAAIVGLVYYLKKMEKKYKIEIDADKKINPDFVDEYLLYNKDDINEKDYKDYLEFYKKKFGEKNILDKNIHDMYYGTEYNEKNLLKKESKKTPCRLKGYYFDPRSNRKSLSTGYNFSKDTVQYLDDQIFDFIPFAFTGSSDETIFLNDNVNLETLTTMNEKLKDYWLERESKEIEKEQENVKKKKKNDNMVSLRKVFIEILQREADYINYGIEIIYKNKNRKYFETWYLRNKSIEILKAIEDLSKLDIRIEINKKYYFKVLDECFNSILNLSSLTNSILFLLKEREKTKYNYGIKELIVLNILIKNGGKKMENKEIREKIKGVAWGITRKIEENKLSSYRQKLLSAAVGKNYHRILEILSQLSLYSGVRLLEAFSEYIENPKKNEDMIHYFIWALLPYEDIN